MSDSEKITKSTLSLLSKLDKFNLPNDQYVITGSGPLAIRGIRHMSDIDLGVSKKLWQELSKSHRVIEENGVTKIRLESDIELFYDGSFGEPINGAPSISEQVEDSEIINGYPFQSIQHSVWFKNHSGRPKDLQDAELIEQWLELEDE